MTKQDSIKLKNCFVVGNPLELGANEEQMMEELEGLLRQKSFTRAAEKALHLGDKLEKMGEKEKALRLKNQAVDFLVKARNQHIERKSWKHVANASFHAAKLLEDLDRSSEALPLIESGIEYLSKASEEYLVWQDLEKATMCFIAFILLKMASEDFEVERNVENYRSKLGISELSHPKENSMLGIPRLLRESVEKTDLALLERAKELTYSLIKDLCISEVGLWVFKKVDNAFIVAEKWLRDKIKFPNVKLQIDFPNEIIHGEEFNVAIKVANEGEGDAKNMYLELNTIEPLTAIETNKVTIDALNAEETISKSFKLTTTGPPPSVEGDTGTEIPITATVTWEDILETKHKIESSPSFITLNALSETKKLENTLGEMKNKIIKITAIIEEKTVGELNSLIKNIMKIPGSLMEEAYELLEKGEQKYANYKIKLLTKLLIEIENFLETLPTPTPENVENLPT